MSFDLEIAKVVLNMGAIGIALLSFGYCWLHIRDILKFETDHEERMENVETKTTELGVAIASIIAANSKAHEADDRIEMDLSLLRGRLEEVIETAHYRDLQFERVLEKLGFPPTGLTRRG